MSFVRYQNSLSQIERLNCKYLTRFDNLLLVQSATLIKLIRISCEPQTVFLFEYFGVVISAQLTLSQIIILTGDLKLQFIDYKIHEAPIDVKQ